MATGNGILLSINTVILRLTNRIGGVKAVRNAEIRSADRENNGNRGDAFQAGPQHTTSVKKKKKYTYVPVPLITKYPQHAIYYVIVILLHVKEIHCVPCWM